MCSGKQMEATGTQALCHPHRDPSVEGEPSGRERHTPSPHGSQAWGSAPRAPGLLRAQAWRLRAEWTGQLLPPPSISKSALRAGHPQLLCPSPGRADAEALGLQGSHSSAQGREGGGALRARAAGPSACEPLTLLSAPPRTRPSSSWTSRGAEAAVGPHGRVVEEVRDPPERRHTPQSRCLISQTDLRA